MQNAHEHQPQSQDAVQWQVTPEYQPMAAISSQTLCKAFEAIADEARQLAGICSPPPRRVPTQEELETRELRALAGLPPLPERWSPEHEYAYFHDRDAKFHLRAPPTALEFARIVAEHRPVLIDGVARAHFPRAFDRWRSNAYLCERMGDRKVTVALTPTGRADDIVQLPQDAKAGPSSSKPKTVFALPYERPMTFEEMLQAFDPERAAQDGIAYLQSQDSNLTAGEDYQGRLLPDVEWRESPSAPLRTDVPWATEALGAPPEATNIWIGTSASQSAMHRDHYENLFTVLRGRKTFLLHPPCENFFLEGGDQHEVWRWRRRRPSEASDGKTTTFVLEPEPDGMTTPWLPIDPSESSTHPRNAAHPLYRRARERLAPVRVVVGTGQTLYLPAGWYHFVAQDEDDGGSDGRDAQGICLCLNWWYDASVNDRWAWSDFAGRLSRQIRGEALDP